MKNIESVPRPITAPHNFWKISQITNQELINTAQTGDILLFTGLQIKAQLIRSFTGSKYDHVGMIIKYQNSGQVVLFESVIGKGVCRWDWKTLHD